VKVAILGCGLMGASLAGALKRRNLASRIVGYDADPDVGARAVSLGLLDAAAPGAAQAATDADLIVLATPVGAMAPLLSQIAPALGASALVTDLGSAKGDVVAAARVALGPAFARFVPGHPIAGGERSGPQNADPDLFRGCTVVVTPAPETRAEALASVEQMWRACGARVVQLDAGDHDRILASVSHLPHLLAFALVTQIAARPEAQHTLAFAGPGFRDFTRIAASSAVMWRDIALANREALGEELRALVPALQRIERALAAGDGQTLEGLFEVASRTRRAMNGDADGR
jgi:prephenate dehydrogenase